MNNTAKFLFALTATLLIAAGCNAVSSSLEAAYPEPTGYVVDAAGVLKPETVTSVTKQLEEFDKAGKGQIAVVLVKTIQPEDIEGYSIKLADKFKAGHKNVDDGVIFVIATEDRKVRIEVGKGLEGKINDAKAGRILDNSVVPFLKNNDWNGGVVSGVKAIQENLQ